ncbi:retrovirus-related pol polyprotein from transposon TNT 1-94 [Tanacetum coccineum]
MSTSNQQTLAESGASDRPTILEKGNYVPWASRFMRHTSENIPEPISKMTKLNKQQYFADIKERHSRPMNEFDKFVAVEGESLTYVYERLTTLINVMDQNKFRPSDITINTKFLNSLQLEWSKYIEENDQTVQRVPRTELNPGKANVQCYNCNAKGHYACDCPKPKVRDASPNARFFMEQMLLAMKDEAEGNLNEEENDFMLDNAYGDDTLEEMSEAVIMMARIQPTDDKSDVEPKYNVKVISEVNASQINLKSGMFSKGVHEHTNHEKLQTVINTSANDQIDSNIIFDDPYVKDNGGKDEHDSMLMINLMMILNP